MTKGKDKNQTKKVKVIKLHIQAGKAAPAPPIGTVLGPTGVNMMDFCKAFNKMTEKLTGKIPTKILINPDRTFSFTIKKPTITCLIKQALNLKTGATNPGKEICAVLNKAQIIDIAKQKMDDFNIYSGDLNKAVKIVSGSARSMGILIEGIEDMLDIKDDALEGSNVS